MGIREHKSHHDDPEELSLLTESARVVDVSALDANRTDEIRHAAARLLDEADRGDLVEESDPPRIDWAGVESFVDEHDDPVTPKLDTLADRFDRSFPSLLSIQVDEEAVDVDFVPGQYLTLRFQDTPRPYSVASSPNAEELEFCVRRVPGGRLTSELFTDLNEGDEVVVRGPNGEFVLQDESARDAAFLATGTGVAPLRSMIQYIFEEGEDTYEGQDRDVWLFLGTSWEDDLAYREFFRDLDDEHDNFHFVPTLTREAYLTDWTGETDYVQRTFVKYLADDVDADLDDPLATYRDEEPSTDIDARIDPSNLEVYACGLTAMVDVLVNVSREVGVPERLVRGEGYG